MARPIRSRVRNLTRPPRERACPCRDEAFEVSVGITAGLCRKVLLRFLSGARMRIHRLRLGLLVALPMFATAASLRAQDVAKNSPPRTAPPAGTEQRPKPITCTVDTSPKPLSAPLTNALHLYRTGKFDDSVVAYNAIISAGGPDMVLAYTGLARVYLKQERLTDAFAAATHAVSLTPGKTPAITALGEVYFRQGKLIQAE